MTDKVDDWDKPIEYVRSDGKIHPCEDLGADSRGHHAVLVHFDGGSQLRICLENGQNPAWDSYIRNKREYAYQWLVKASNGELFCVTTGCSTLAEARGIFGDCLIRPIEETKREVE